MDRPQGPLESPEDQEPQGSPGAQGPPGHPEPHHSVPPPRRSYPWVWALLLAVVAGTSALMLGAVGWFAAAAVTGKFFDPDSGTKVSCDEAMAFARRELPAGAYDRRCESQGMLDIEYDVRFRTTARELTDWMNTSFPVRPDSGLRAEFCAEDDVDACTQLDLGEPPPDGAVAADVTVVYEDGGTVLVHFRPFNV